MLLFETFSAERKLITISRFQEFKTKNKPKPPKDLCVK